MPSGSQEAGPVKVFDVAAYIIKQIGVVPAMKLHKLVYYSQAWSLVWDELPLFLEPVEAWANGPVVRSLYARHRGVFLVSKKMLGGSTKSSTKTNAKLLTLYWISTVTRAPSG